MKDREIDTHREGGGGRERGCEREGWGRGGDRERGGAGREKERGIERGGGR